ncbi:TIGR03915 family putative DNA repair protein, partial [Nostoc sp. NIES-2111]
MGGGAATIRRVRLAGPSDFDGFRAKARGLLAEGVPPEAVLWSAGDEAGDLFAADIDAGASPVAAARPVPRVSRAFLALAGQASLHSDPGRFSLIYRLLWRLGGEPNLPALASDPDIVRLNDLAKAVRRDIHKMHAFVRFRDVEGPGGEAFVAWYEPDHHVVEAASTFFVKRFASLVWTILTPECTAHWTGETLMFGPGAGKADAPSQDRLE